MMVTRCEATTKAGTPCKATARAGRPYCLFHDPEAVEERRDGSRKGGQNRANTARAERQMVAYNIGSIRIVLSTVLRDLLAGEVDSGVASAAATLGRAVIHANEKGELEKRIAELERKAGIVAEERRG